MLQVHTEEVLGINLKWAFSYTQQNIFMAHASECIHQISLVIKAAMVRMHSKVVKLTRTDQYIIGLIS